uniref:Radiation-inducible immediate-early gene IEX-1 n=1 Tax=Strigops habroptila TaxID=2489341 RepID=A0A672TXS8_STRHB
VSARGQIPGAGGRHIPEWFVKRLPRPMFAVRAAGRPPGLPAKRSRKARRVLYPAQVRKYLPRQEKDLVKRWLLFFAGVILMQVLTEDPEQERLAGGKSLRAQPLCAPASLCAPTPALGPLEQHHGLGTPALLQGDTRALDGDSGPAVAGRSIDETPGLQQELCRFYC